MVCVPELVPEMIVQAARHTDSQSGWSFRYATLLAHATWRALDRLGTAQLEAIHGCYKGDSLPLNIRTAHRRRDCVTLYKIWHMKMSRRPWRGLQEIFKEIG